MKYIWLGIKDYCRDCWHDWLLNRINKYAGSVYDYEPINGNLVTGRYVPACYWKEGNVWHYIRQRKIANKTKR